MKHLKTIILFIFLSISFFTSSQEHFQFKNIPINGNISEFAKELVKDGFIVKMTESNYIFLSGSFVGKKCELLLIGTKKSNNIWQVNLALPKMPDWSSIKDDYLILKKQYTTKYGEGKSIESFSEPYREGEGKEFQAFLMGKGRYLTVWETALGMIYLSISEIKQIIIKYEDKTNSLLDEEETDEKIKNEI